MRWQEPLPAIRGQHVEKSLVRFDTLPPRDLAHRAAQRAESMVKNRLSFFDLNDVFLGDPIRWNHEHSIDRPAPMGFAPAIDYRDRDLTGDAKVVWEPSRCHQHVVLARAYMATGDERFAASAVKQIESWIEQCPFGRGMQWRSPLEIAIRAINWVWTFDLIRRSQSATPEFRSRLEESLYQHVWEISRKYSRSSSANNHLVGEAAGVFITTAYFDAWAESEQWNRRAFECLSHEINIQSYHDGGGREQAIGYQLFVLGFFFSAGLVARASARDFAPAYWARLERMCEFVNALCEGGEALPMFGDADDGRVLDLCAAATDPRPLLGIAASLFDRVEFAITAGKTADDAIYWMCGENALARVGEMRRTTLPSVLKSRAFPETGCYLLQSGQPGERSAMSLSFDCGELGWGPLAAHGHADALSVHLRIGGVDVLVDPGTYDYFSFPEWRRYFRSTAAHNTIVVDATDQSEMLGPFLWGVKARAHCIEWAPNFDGGRVVGEHDGYTRLKSPLIHRRSVTLDASQMALQIEDVLECDSKHEFRLHFHLGESCRAVMKRPNDVQVEFEGGLLEFRFQLDLRVELVGGDDHCGIGWVSRGYHSKTRSTTIVAAGSAASTAKFMTHLTVRLNHHRDGVPEEIATSTLKVSHA